MAMPSSKFNVNSTLTIAVTCFLALAVSIRFFIYQLLFPKPNRNRRSCYLNGELGKPQYSFKWVLAENSYSQFKHLKLNVLESNPNEEFSNLHPYKGEISMLTKEPDMGFMAILDECYKEGDDRGDGSYAWIMSETQLQELVEVLSKEKIFAVDTEQHSFRSFLGFTALVQISTLNKDYLVDAILLHDMMGLLRPVFANPEVCKVFHGADNDVLWLQRDFHIYVVNLFDTAKACDVLSKPQRSLAYLLETYCHVTTNKLLQREDWRQRPLPEEMIQYARTDAHHLLYIAYCLCLELKLLRNENSSPGDQFHFLLEACRRSNATCLQLFAKDIEGCPGELAASSIVSRCLNGQANISSSQCDSKFQELVRRLCLWRDIMARLHDESLKFVLSDNAIVALAAKSPKNEDDLRSTISEADVDVESSTLGPLQSPSTVVSSHWEDLVRLFQETTVDLNKIFEMFIRKLIGPSGSCPISAFNYAFLSKNNLIKVNNRSGFNHNGIRAAKHLSKKSSRELFVQKFSCKSPVYHSCKIYANDGRLLCYCDRRKLEWYLNRKLAKLVEEDPPSIMLLFEPKGRPEDEDNDFYIQSKKNICVGCGEGSHYLRYRIIPSCYRMHFPEHLKSHRSHDIVLLCVDCHEIAHAAAEKYKRKLATELGIPLFIRKVVDLDKAQDEHTCSSPTVTSEEIGVSPLQLRTAAMALLRHGPQMPTKRREELIQIVKNYYGGREISNEDLDKALLVGMSPHERRKFDKRRSLTLKRPTLVITSNKTGDQASLSNSNISNGETMRCSYINVSETDQRQEMSDVYTHQESNNDDISASEDVPNGTSSPVHGTHISTKSEKKLSLLGHGPHGKQVVDHLLKEHGEDGIRNLCQRFRQIFVEALRPRFLPAGWDVMHSGKRDFGDFSVYKPTKSSSAIPAAGV